MNTTDNIIITGASGFIGSYLTSHLNHLGFKKLYLVDDFSRYDKFKNLLDKNYLEKIPRDMFFDWWDYHKDLTIDAVFHLGARTDTTEMDYEVHKKWNLDFSKKIWERCTAKEIPLVYASSAATYGDGSLGYKDDHDIVEQLTPLNPYGVSKNEFDKWALKEKKHPPFWAGVKFFNVYGPNEYHKGRMASVIFHAYHQIQNNGFIKLFRSHHPDFQDGEQQRDFIYVKDVAKMCTWLMNTQPDNGLYNIGTGNARSFNDLARSVFLAMHLPEKIEYIDTPADIREKYQYFTEADMAKIKSAGYKDDFYSLEEGVYEYVSNYLQKDLYF